MLTNYFTLFALSQELHKKLAGSFVREIFTQQKNELIISLHNKTQEYSLSVSINPHLNYVFYRDSVSRAKKNSVDLFQQLVGASINTIEILDYERIICIRCNNDLTLHLALFNTSASNIYLTDSKNDILEAFKHNKDLKGAQFPTQKVRFSKEVLKDADQFSQLLSQKEDTSIFERLKSIVPILGSTFAREVLHRAKIEEHKFVKDLSTKEVKSLISQLSKLFKELANPRATIYYRGDVPKIFSVIQLHHLAGSRAETYDNVNEGIRRFLGYVFHHQTVESEKKSIIGKLKSLLERTKKSIATIEEEVLKENAAEKYERIGNIIMANLQHLTKGTKEIDLPDYIDPEKTVRIKMDPKLTPAQNAEYYFEKSKKAKIARNESEQRYTKLKEVVKSVEKLLLHLDGCHTSEQLEEFKKVNNEQLVSLKIISQKAGEKRLPFRIFSLEGGFEVWVGKSSASNDELTMKYAKPNDLWFHVRGAGGSHTILRIEGSKQMPSKSIIEKAAAIAAYYSKMRNAGSVPVAYCERKYVRKPKGVPEGTVYLEREKVIFVEPKLPQ